MQKDDHKPWLLQPHRARPSIPRPPPGHYPSSWAFTADVVLAETPLSSPSCPNPPVPPVPLLKPRDTALAQLVRLQHAPLVLYHISPFSSSLSFPRVLRFGFCWCQHLGYIPWLFQKYREPPSSASPPLPACWCWSCPRLTHQAEGRLQIVVLGSTQPSTPSPAAQLSLSLPFCLQSEASPVLPAMFALRALVLLLLSPLLI